MHPRFKNCCHFTSAVDGNRPVHMQYEPSHPVCAVRAFTAPSIPMAADAKSRGAAKDVRSTSMPIFCPRPPPQPTNRTTEPHNACGEPHNPRGRAPQRTRIRALGGVVYCVLRMRIAYSSFGRGCVLRIAFCVCVLRI